MSLQDLINSITGVNTTGSVPGTPAPVTGSNTGSTLDLSAGYAPLITNDGTTAGTNSGQQIIPVTGNSFVDSLSALSNLAVNTLSKGLSSYSSYLEAGAVANAANKLNTTPGAILGSLPTVQTAAQTQAAQQSQTNMTYLLVGGALIAAVMIFGKRRHA